MYITFYLGWFWGSKCIMKIVNEFKILFSKDSVYKCNASLRMVTRARKSSEASESKKQEAKGKLGRRRGRRLQKRMQSLFFPPLSSFPLGHFALSTAAELS